jgi:glycyl-tRNA synthetase beta chain
LGAIRIILENKIRLSLLNLWVEPLIHVDVDRRLSDEVRALSQTEEGLRKLEMEAEIVRLRESIEDYVNSNEYLGKRAQLQDKIAREVLDFLADRLKVALKENGTRHDLIDAVFSLGHEDDLVRLVDRVNALQTFLKSEDGVTLLAGYKRAVNILKIEEKKDGKTFISEVSEKLLSEPAEKALFAALTKARAAITAVLDKEDFVAAMQQMASLRVPVDSFFEGVKVNADDKQVRENRLSLLASLRATLHQVADFSRIEG